MRDNESQIKRHDYLPFGEELFAPLHGRTVSQGYERRRRPAAVHPQRTGCWIRAHHNLHLTGPTGTGKSWLACALGQQACRQGLSVRYERVARLLETLRVARGDGSYHKRLATFAKAELLILDDLGLKPLTQAERLDLLELIDDRHGRRSTLVTSQLPIAHWHAYLGEDPTVADALLDRLLSAAHRLELKGESLRKRQKQNGKELDAERAKQ